MVAMPAAVAATVVVVVATVVAVATAAAVVSVQRGGSRDVLVAHLHADMDQGVESCFYWQLACGR